MAREAVLPDTLTVTHVYLGQECVTGGEDGQVFIATFNQADEAESYVKRCQYYGQPVHGWRNEKPR